MKDREKERVVSRLCVCVSERERERESVCERERERERESVNRQIEIVRKIRVLLVKKSL